MADTACYYTLAVNRRGAGKGVSGNPSPASYFSQSVSFVAVPPRAHHTTVSKATASYFTWFYAISCTTTYYASRITGRRILTALRPESAVANARVAPCGRSRMSCS